MQKQQLIGLSGTNGAGKDSVGLLLAEKHGYLFISVSDLLRDEVRKRGLPVERQHLREVSMEWRREFGMAVLVDRAVEKFETVKSTYAGLVLASLRNPLEADRVHELGGEVIWVDADPKLRYERIRANAAERNRGGEDDVTFEQFLAQEETEMHASSKDVASLDMSAVKARADKTLLNNFKSVEELDEQVTETFHL